MFINPDGSALINDIVRAAIANGLGFSASTKSLTSPGAGTFPQSLFNPTGNLKTFIVYSVKVASASVGPHSLQTTNADPALGTASTVSNDKSNGGTATASASLTNVSTAPGASVFKVTLPPANQLAEFLLNNEVRILQPGQGLEVFANLTAAAAYFSEFCWVELPQFA